MTIDPDKLWHFHGGLHLPPQKSMSTTAAIAKADLPALLTLPVSQHIGTPAAPVVKVGERVLKGQMIAKAKDYVSAPIHAPSSGTVVAIEARPVPHPSGMDAECIIMETDGREEWLRRRDHIDDYTQLSRSELRNRLREAGIVGLGGAGFPTFVKMNPGPERPIDLLILNGAECEPYISCDDMLMREYSWEIVVGLRILRYAVHARECVVAIEDNMPAAHAAMELAVTALGDPGVRLVKIPAVYPAGGEKQLIKALTNREVPSEGLPADIGVVCQNVGTAAAVCRAVTEREPLISRIVTVTGGGVTQPRNINTLIGTPISQLIDQCGGYTNDAHRLLMGGPLMGIPLASDRLPVTKTTNCILVATTGDIAAPRPPLPCIRCGDCVQVCPANLLPQQLYWYAHAKDTDKVKEYGLFDCIECGCCSYVCPSHIPLVDYYRYAKTEIWSRELAREQAERAGRRHEYRTQRLERDKQARAARSKRKKEALARRGSQAKDSKPAEIQAVLDRVRAKQKGAAVTPEEQPGKAVQAEETTDNGPGAD